MSDGPPRLLVSLAADLARPTLARRLPSVPVEFATPESAGPWPEVEAMLVGTLAREIPQWSASMTPHLRFIQRLFTGLNDFPFERVPPTVEVAGNVGAYAPFVAEHAVLLTLALVHDLEGSRALVHAGLLRPPPPNRHLIGRTALLLGFGAIARELAVRFHALGMRVEGVARRPGVDPRAERIWAADEILDALPGADVTVDCRPLTRLTRGSIDAAALARMRPDSVFVNVGRAATVDQEALYRHLVAHPGFRAGTDVWWDEDFQAGELRARFPFAELPNFLGTPHIAGIGKEARARALEMAVENLARFFDGERPRHIADRTEYR
ncbi:MAG: NAD(P)-dependent oxidoreductase [Thermoplasmata archaeon]